MLIEEDMIRGLVGVAGATDDDLRRLVADAREDFMALLPDIPDDRLDTEEASAYWRDGFTDAERSLIESAKDGLSEEQWARFQV